MIETQVNEAEQAVATKKFMPKFSFTLKRWSWFLLGLVLALSVSSLLFYQYKHKENQNFLKQQQNSFQAYIQNNQKQIQQLQTDLAELKSQNLQQQIILKQQQRSLQELLQHSSYTDIDWTLAEVKYLLRLADLKLRYSYDSAAALDLLQIAYPLLQALQEPQLLTIQQILAKHIVFLRNALPVKVEAILLQITALSQQITQLPLVTPKLSVENDNSDHSLTGQLKAGWRQALQASLASLRKLVVIRRNDQPITPLLAPEQRFYLEQNLLLVLDKAQTAALHGQNQVYQAKLQLAIDWIKHYFANNEIVVQAMLSNLTHLKAINIVPNGPDLTTLIDNLNNYIEQRHKPLVLPLSIENKKLP